ncbi:MAG: hypothetical protein NT030_06510 [Candidatus Saganbacteria bacterium]|nr:hypothetical protein [Candidatus Saganbacteria bacterium]
MKKLVLALVVVAMMASMSYAAKTIGLEYRGIIGSIDPTYGLSAFENMALESPVILPSGHIGLAWDVTDVVTVFGGADLYNITNGSLSMLADEGNTSNGLGATLGVKVRLAKGNLIPVLGGSIAMSSISANEDDAFASSINATRIAVTFGCEYTITPGLVLMVDGTMIDLISGTATVMGGNAVKLDSMTRLLPGGEIGLRWYII